MAIEEHKTVDGSLLFDAEKCIHSRNCVLNRPDVFVPNVEGEWIHPEMADAGELQALADSCPSGAIQFAAAAKTAKAPLVNTLHIRENGPYAVRAEIQMDGLVNSSTRLTLCRCGASKNKPYCDCTHDSIGFQASGEVTAVASEPLENRGGALAVKPHLNGPLQMSGNLEICNGTGHTVNRVTSTYLCRCGGSSNKPYCDGSHKTNGFSSED
jgi:CDGSH-type Zn-finger protein/uncharacterized Fe-S cluster protein YjdI